MNIIFYGASVTEQSEGYYKQVINSSILANYSFQKLTFGGCHLDDAGFYNIDKLNEMTGDVVVLEWSTTARETYDLEKINYILNKIIRNKSLPIILIIPHAGNSKVSRNAENQLIDISRRLRIPLIDLRSNILEKYSLESLLRDNVHTNESGAKVIGNLVAKELINIIESHAEFANNIRLPDGIDCHIKRSNANGKIMVAEASISLRINAFSNRWELCFYHEIGRHSPIVNVMVNNKFCHVISFWDPYCHYSRMHYTAIASSDNIELQPNCEMTLVISKKMPDFSLCRRDNISFDIGREIRVHDLYSYGVEYEVTECQ